MTDNAERIERIRAKAEGMGLQVEAWAHAINFYNGVDEHGTRIPLFEVPNYQTGWDTAARLLSALAPGPVVEQFINDESEFPDAVPDELLKIFEGKIEEVGLEKAFQQICRAAVSVTKTAMLRRLGPASDDEEWRLCLLPKGGDDE